METMKRIMAHKRIGRDYGLPVTENSTAAPAVGRDKHHRLDTGQEATGVVSATVDTEVSRSTGCFLKHQLTEVRVHSAGAA